MNPLEAMVSQSPPFIAATGTPPEYLRTHFRWIKSGNTPT